MMVARTFARGTDAMLVVALGARNYRVSRSFGAWPKNAGHVTDVTVTPQGNPLVMLRQDPYLHPQDHRIVELDETGGFLRGWGGADIADSHSLTAADDGRIFAVDRDMHEIIIFSGDGVRIGSLGTRGGPLAPFNHPTDVAVSAWGDIYVSDGYAASHVHRFSATGTHIATWGSFGAGEGQFAEPHALWALPDRRIAVVDRCNHRIAFYDAEGKLLQSVGGFRRPVAIWGDARNFLYVTDETPCLTLLSPTGERVGRCRPVVNGAHGIYGTPDGVLYLAETNPSRVTRLDPI